MIDYLSIALNLFRCGASKYFFVYTPRRVTWDREHQDLSGIKSIGVNEIAWQRGHVYLTLAYQIDGHYKRLLWIGEKRTTKTRL